MSYDVDAGLIEFSDNATITEGGNKISSNVLVYNITAQRIYADSPGEYDSRVRITYSPTYGVEPPPDDEDAADDEEEAEDP